MAIGATGLAATGLRLRGRSPVAPNQPDDGFEVCVLDAGDIDLRAVLAAGAQGHDRQPEPAEGPGRVDVYNRDVTPACRARSSVKQTAGEGEVILRELIPKRPPSVDGLEQPKDEKA